MKIIENYIDGKLRTPQNNQYLDVFNPATGEVYAKCPASNRIDVENAVQAAQAVFESWSNSSIEYRSNILLKIANLVKKRFEDLVVAESMDNGKPKKLARKVDIPRAKTNIEFFATAIRHFATQAHEIPSLAVNYTLRRPIGIVGCISPWNLPLYLFTWKIAPALATGNCVIGKPSEVTPLTAYILSKICIEAGLPSGVLNIIHGHGHDVGAAITEHPGIKAISFTGSTHTGKLIAETAAPKFKKLSLEMGGKNPNIIFADCDFDQMIRTTIRSSFANQGQICLCGSRILIERPIYQRFKDEFIRQTEKLVVGDPENENTDLGAVVSNFHMNKILSCIELAKEEGGRILTGGYRIELDGKLKNGYFIAPTIIEGLDMKCRTNQEEIFGPVVTIMPFDSDEEVIELANDVEYGLSASVWTQNISRANHMANQIEAGIIWVNTWLLRDLRTPFGGMKNSGVGREGGLDALRFFTEPKKRLYII